LKMSIVRWKLLSWKDKPHEGFKCTSAPGQSKSPSVRRTRRDDFDWDSSQTFSLLDGAIVRMFGTLISAPLLAKTPL
jgi:hypothetical protein